MRINKKTNRLNNVFEWKYKIPLSSFYSILFFCISFNLISIAHARDSTLVIPAVSANLLFTKVEIEVDSIGKSQSRTPKLAIQSLDNLRKKYPEMSSSELAYLLAYQCWFEVSLQANSPGEKLSAKNELSNLVGATSRSPSALAASELCRAYESYYQMSRQAYIAHLEKSYEYAKDAKSQLLKYWVSHSYAIEAQNDENHAEVIVALQTAIEIAQANLDIDREARSRQMLAISEAKLQLFSDALRNNERAMNIRKKQNAGPAYLKHLLMNRGYMLIEMNSLTEAKKVFEEAMQLAKETKDEQSVHSIYTNLAAIALRESKFQSAIDYSLKVIEYGEINKIVELPIHGHSILASAYASIENDELAKKSYDIAVKHFTETKQLRSLAGTVLGWSDVMETKGRYLEALRSYKHYKNIEDRINAQTAEDRMQKLRVVFQSKEKDFEIRELREKSLLQSIELKNQSLQKRVWLLMFASLALGLGLILSMYRRIKLSHQLLEQENVELDRQRFCDPLTGSFNRRYFDESLAPKIDSYALNTESSSATIYALDIDHFKQVNDTYGHDAGDKVLIEFAARLKQSLRGDDILVRMGGEEFVLVARTRSKEKAQDLAKKLLKLISSEAVDYEGMRIPITVSVGVVRFEKEVKMSCEDAMKAADKCLYEAKEKGRNRAIYLRSELYQSNDETLSTHCLVV